MFFFLNHKSFRERERGGHFKMWIYFPFFLKILHYKTWFFSRDFPKRCHWKGCTIFTRGWWLRNGYIFPIFFREKSSQHITFLDIAHWSTCIFSQFFPEWGYCRTLIYIPIFYLREFFINVDLYSQIWKSSKSLVFFFNDFNAIIVRNKFPSFLNTFTHFYGGYIHLSFRL